MLETRDGEEKVAAFVRLIDLLDGKAKVDDLATDFLNWNHPVYGDRVRDRWAFFYYAAADAAPSLPAQLTTDDVEDDSE